MPRPTNNHRRIPVRGEVYVNMDTRGGCTKKVRVLSIELELVQVEDCATSRHSRIRLENFYEADAVRGSGYRLVTEAR